MTAPHEATLAALHHARQLVHELHDDDIAERWWDRSIDLPEGVSVRFDTMGNNPERVRSIVVSGKFSIESLRGAAESERYVDQADVWDLTFPSLDDATPARGSSVDTCGQGGSTAKFIIAPDVRRVSTTPRTDAAPSAGPSDAETRQVSNTPSAGGALIGELVPCEPFDVTEMMVERIVDLLATLRSGVHDIENLLVLRPADDATAMFGTPPSYLPVVGTMTDGAVLGHMIDAEELGKMSPTLLLYELRMEGAVPTDERFVLPTVIDRATNSRWPIGQAPPGAVALAEALHVTLREGVPSLEFSWGVKRRRPSIAPTGWRWRHDSSGNAVLAPKAAWGTVSISRPTSATKGMSKADELAASAPAAALYCAQEALVLANRNHDGPSISAAYAAMVAPLVALDRPRIAARAASLATV